MKIKVFQTNPNGKIEFTPAELEKLLNDTYKEGQCNCNCIKDINKEESCECVNPSLKPYPSITMKKLSKEDMERVSKEIASLLNTNRSLRPHEVQDVFTNLAKELNF